MQLNIRKHNEKMQGTQKAAPLILGVIGRNDMKTTINLIIYVISSISLVSCALDTGRMKSTFNQALQKTIGRSLDELKNSPTQAFIGKRNPERISQVSDNRILHIYDYWKGTKMVRDGNCKVYLYFKISTMVVTKAKSEGKGCYTAY
ncbi:MAG: hypothetical protein GY834_03195 [Bacteroidetes bacterium]|nr:hypothetical protein [Bacteroidota bacterium]